MTAEPPADATAGPPSPRTTRGAHPWPTSPEDMKGRHRGLGAAGGLRAAVFGANDGLVSNTSLIFGIAGATSAPDVLVLTGVAGLLAGAFSMAAGEWISVKSQRELAQALVEEEREEIEKFPAEEQEELALIYASRGIPLEEARGIARRVFADPKKALDAHVREELGLNPKDLGRPWLAAGASFLAFALGAFIPLLPFLVPLPVPPVVVSGALAAVSLFAVGAIVARLASRSVVGGGLRMLLIGASAAALTFGAGKLLGVSVS